MKKPGLYFIQQSLVQAILQKSVIKHKLIYMFLYNYLLY